MSQQQPHVWLVDDDPNAEFFAKRSLRKVCPGAHLTYFEYAREALSRLVAVREEGATPPEVLLLDLNMPDLAGWAFVEQAGERLRGVRVYVLSSSVDPEDLARAEREAFVAAYLEKHLTAEKMQRALGGT